MRGPPEQSPGNRTWPGGRSPGCCASRWPAAEQSGGGVECMYGNFQSQVLWVKGWRYHAVTCMRLFSFAGTRVQQRWQTARVPMIHLSQQTPRRAASFGQLKHSTAIKQATPGEKLRPSSQSGRQPGAHLCQQAKRRVHDGLGHALLHRTTNIVHATSRKQLRTQASKQRNKLSASVTLSPAPAGRQPRS